MLKQQFNEESISRVLDKNDLKDYPTGIGIDPVLWMKSEIDKSPNGISGLKIGLAKGKTVFSPKSGVDRVKIKVADRFIRRIYSVKQSDRAMIVKQLSCVLKDSSDLSIIRFDISSCYENMDFSALIERLSLDSILAPNMIGVVSNIRDISFSLGCNGLPRGLCVSATLAELFLEKLDDSICSLNGVVYFARYVDDFIVICASDRVEDNYDEIISELNNLGMSLNDRSEKNYKGLVLGSKFEYLGYGFDIPSGNKKRNEVEIGIAGTKLKKIKTRIYLSFFDYKRSGDFSLLKQRINYLSVLKPVKHSKNGNVIGGLADQYKSVTHLLDYKILDGFYNEMIKEFSGCLSPLQKSALEKVSFYARVKNKSFGVFTRSKSHKIVRVWKNV